MKIIDENKATDEIARIKRLNKKHAKEKGWGWFVHPKGIYTNTNAGNVEYNNAVFNSAMEMVNGSSEGGASQAVAENLKSSDNIVDYIETKFKNYLTNYPPEGPSYITRQGKFLDIVGLADDMGDDYPEDFPSHGAIQTIMMFDGVAEKPGQFDDGSPILREEGFIRLNNIEEDNNYIELSKVKPTAEQYDALLIWLDDNERSYPDINVCTEQFKDFVSYRYSDYTTDEIIDKIKRYYSSGNLYESKMIMKLLESHLAPIPENYDIIETEEFKRAWKKQKLSDADLQKLKKELKEEPAEAPLGSCVYKFRFSPSTSNRGQSSQDRVIYVQLDRKNKCYLLTIFEKDKQSDLSPKELVYLRKIAKMLGDKDE